MINYQVLEKEKSFVFKSTMKTNNNSHHHHHHQHHLPCLSREVVNEVKMGIENEKKGKFQKEKTRK